jgi:enhancing lycopene biosynthesis protein 2
MRSRERLLAAIAGERPDHVPCSFMLFFSLYERCSSDAEFVERQLELGLDPFVHVGHLNHQLHRYGGLATGVSWKEWVEERDGLKLFCRRIDTPAGPLESRVRQRDGWPTAEDFPLLKDWLVPRFDKILVDPERDLAKLPYLFGPVRDEDIRALREEARAASRLAARHGLLLVGGWKGTVRPGLQVDPGVMGADAMAWLSGFETVMVLSLTRPDLIQEYAQVIHRWNLEQIRVYLEQTEADLIVRRGWYETTEFWTPNAWRAIIAPTLKREAELVHQAGRRFGYIITSAFLPLLDDILGSGVDVIIGVDPEEGKGTQLPPIKRKCRAAGRALWGGVSGPVTVELGTEGQTEAAVRQALEVLGAGGGFILSPVDNVREDTENSRRNTRAFIEAWKRHREVRT